MTFEPPHIEVALHMRILFEEEGRGKKEKVLQDLPSLEPMPLTNLTPSGHCVTLSIRLPSTAVGPQSFGGSPDSLRLMIEDSREVPDFSVVIVANIHYYFSWEATPESRIAASCDPLVFALSRTLKSLSISGPRFSSF